MPKGTGPTDSISGDARAQDGVNDYYAGVVPKNWDNVMARAYDPYLSAWYFESMIDNGYTVAEIRSLGK